MVFGPAGVMTQPMMRFRPDPGEPAVRLTARPHESAGLVTAQEQRNETRLRLQALARGEDIIYSNRTFTLGVSGVSPVYNAGLTTVVSRVDENGFAPDNLQNQAEEEDEQQVGQAEEETNNIFEAIAPEETDPTQPSEEELQREELDLQNEDSRIERNLTRARLEKDQAAADRDPFDLEQTKREENRLARELEEIDREQRKVKLEKQAQQMEETQQTAANAINDNLAAASGLLNVMFGFGSEDYQPA